MQDAGSSTRYVQPWPGCHGRLGLFKLDGGGLCRSTGTTGSCNMSAWSRLSPPGPGRDQDGVRAEIEMIAALKVVLAGCSGAGGKNPR